MIILSHFEMEIQISMSQTSKTKLLFLFLREDKPFYVYFIVDVGGWIGIIMVDSNSERIEVKEENEYTKIYETIA
jgi:hypothetical protein